MKIIILPLLKLYKRFISKGINTNCRYTPTCSIYAMQAIEEWGALVGGVMGLIRIIRCNPLSHGGYQPVKRCRYKHLYTI